MSKILIALPLLLIGGLSALLYWGLSQDPNQRATPLLGKTAPVEQFIPLNADEKSLAEISAENDLYVLNFFASWCPPCRIEHPQLMQLAQEHKIQLVGIAYKDTPKATRAFLQQYGNPYVATYSDPKGIGAIDYGLVGVPETFIVKQGKIIYHFAGPITESILHAFILPEINKGITE